MYKFLTILLTSIVALLFNITVINAVVDVDTSIPLSIGDEFPKNSAYDVLYCSLYDAVNHTSPYDTRTIAICWSNQYTRTSYYDVSVNLDVSYYEGISSSASTLGYLQAYYLDGEEWTVWDSPSGDDINKYKVTCWDQIATTHPDINARQSGTRTFSGCLGSVVSGSYYTVSEWVGEPAFLPDENGDESNTQALPYATLWQYDLGDGALAQFRTLTSDELIGDLDGNTLTIGYEDTYYQKWIRAPFEYEYPISTTETETVLSPQGYVWYVYDECIQYSHTDDCRLPTTKFFELDITGIDYCSWIVTNYKLKIYEDGELINTCENINIEIWDKVTDVIDEITDNLPFISEPTCSEGDFWCYITLPVINAITSIAGWFGELVNGINNFWVSLIYPDPITLALDFVDFYNDYDNLASAELAEELTSITLVTPIPPPNFSFPFGSTTVTVLDWDIFGDFYDGSLKDIFSAMISLSGLGIFLAIFKYIYDN